MQTEWLERALDVEGTVTGEHGIGIGKLDLMEQEHGEALSVMKDLKNSLIQKIS